MAEIESQRILVSIDGSEAGRAAASYGIRLARRLSATLIVVGVVDASIGIEPPDLPDTTDLLDYVEDLRRNEVDKIVEEARRVGVANLERHTVVGDPPAALIQAARDDNADLIVIGSRRCGAIQRLLMGNTAEYLVRNAPVAVLVVRSDQERHPEDRTFLPISPATEELRAKPGGGPWHLPILHLFRRSV